MSIQVGDFIPQELATHAARSPARVTIYYFMRTIDCPICRSHVNRLTALKERVRDLGANVLIVAPGVTAEPPAWASSLPFPLLISATAHASVGFSQVLGALQQSGTIVADPKGRVLSVRRSTLPFQAFDERELLELLQKLSGEASRASNDRAAVV
ncbi:MAG: redoxin domain-containing protein [Myxococcota bacterium]